MPPGGGVRVGVWRASRRLPCHCHRGSTRSRGQALPRPMSPTTTRRDVTGRGRPRGPRSTGCPAGGLNIAHEAVDRHAPRARAARARAALARRRAARSRLHLRASWRGDTNRFANVLARLGVGRGERVFALLAAAHPELYVAALGTLKRGCVFSPLFSAFGPGARARAHGRKAARRVLVTTPGSTAARWRRCATRCLRSSMCCWSAGRDGATPPDTQRL